MLALLIYLLGQRSSAEWVSWVMMGVTASRYLLVMGVLASATLARPNPFRAVGALGTYVGGTVLALALLFAAA